MVKRILERLLNIYITRQRQSQKLLLVDRVELMQETESYIISQDRKQESPNKVMCHLIDYSI